MCYVTACSSVRLSEIEVILLSTPYLGKSSMDSFHVYYMLQLYDLRLLLDFVKTEILTKLRKNRELAILHGFISFCFHTARPYKKKLYDVRVYIDFAKKENL